MKLCLVIPSFYPAIAHGGPVYSTLNACEEISKLGIIINVSTTNVNGKEKMDVPCNKFVKFSDNFYVKYYNETITGKISLKLILNLWKDIIKADIVHIQAVFNTPVPVAFFYAKLFRKPIVYTPRGAFCKWGQNKKKLRKRLWIFLLLKPFVRNIKWHVTSEQEKKDVLDFFPKAVIQVIPNGIYSGKLKPVKMSKPDYLKKFTGKDLNSTKMIVSMGRIHKVKGFDILIKSFKKIIDKYPDAILLIAGKDDGELNNLNKLIDDLNLTERVFFAGNIVDQDKADFLGNADLFVLPSHTENFGNVYAESLAAGTPVVAGIHTPWEEIEAAGCGHWIDNNIDDNVTAILDLLNKDREQLRQNALNFAKEFEGGKIALRFKKLYESMLFKY